METLFSPQILAKAPTVDYRFLAEAAKRDPLSIEFQELFKASKLSEYAAEKELQNLRHKNAMELLTARSEAEMALLKEKQSKEERDAEIKAGTIKKVNEEANSNYYAGYLKKFKDEFKIPLDVLTYEFADPALNEKLAPIKELKSQITSVDAANLGRSDLERLSLKFGEAIKQDPTVRKLFENYKVLKTMIDTPSTYHPNLVGKAVEEFTKTGSFNTNVAEYQFNNSVQGDIISNISKAAIAGISKEAMKVDADGYEYVQKYYDKSPEAVKAIKQNLASIFKNELEKLSVAGAGDPPEVILDRIVGQSLSNLADPFPTAIRNDQRASTGSGSKGGGKVTNVESLNDIAKTHGLKIKGVYSDAISKEGITAIGGAHSNPDKFIEKGADGKMRIKGTAIEIEYIDKAAAAKKASGFSDRAKNSLTSFGIKEKDFKAIFPTLDPAKVNGVVAIKKIKDGYQVTIEANGKYEYSNISAATLNRLKWKTSK